VRESSPSLFFGIIVDTVVSDHLSTSFSSSPSTLCHLPHLYCSGRSFCREHSNSIRPIPKFGYPDPVRVCKDCEIVIDQEVNDGLSRVVPLTDQLLGKVGSNSMASFKSSRLSVWIINSNIFVWS
jgi:hypothetical protein